MDNSLREKWYVKLIWSLGLAVLGGAITLTVALITGIIQDKRPDLYYVINPQIVHASSGGDYVFGSIEMGNDGSESISDWVARLTFPEGVSIKSLTASPEVVFKEPEHQGTSVSRIMEYSGTADILNPGDRILVQYVISKAGTVTVGFKGLGSTASQRPPEAQGRGSPNVFSYITFVITVALVVISFYTTFNVYMARRQARFTRECAEHCEHTLGELQEMAEKRICDMLTSRLESAPEHIRPDLLAWLKKEFGRVDSQR